MSSSSSSSSEQEDGPQEPLSWARRTARKTTSAKSAAHTQHISLAPVEPEHWEPAAMEAGSVPSTSSEPCDKDRPPTAKEEVGATPHFSMGAVATALQQASEATPDPAGLPANPASPSGSENQVEAASSPTSPAMVEISPELSQAPSQVPTTAEVVGSTPPASQAEGDKSTSHDGPSGQDLGFVEVECREALRAQWLSFPFQPGEVAASTLARCRTETSMASLDTLAVWPDGGMLDLTLTLRRACGQTSGVSSLQDRPS